ncbi:hypothetical protein LJ739_02445 [Aestuariibacter halophilus]|uniref:Uncharacterized protein n=1 Tax=Fluctibacter halophilus TaxID=226011 RepID=A0ABS8G4N7_9ALTE|nr:hypothetical protein [Aestuariibacter halophilus]MCC2615101.1 hypothetical protein [Aestuariibacter halophilus]
MNTLKLDHQDTPSQLKAINHKIESLFDTQPLDGGALLALINERHDIVVAALEGMDADAKRRFAEHENTINQALVQHVVQLRKDSLQEVSALMKGLKAVKKYK